MAKVTIDGESAETVAYALMYDILHSTGRLDVGSPKAMSEDGILDPTLGSIPLILPEQHGRTRRSWRKLHVAVDAGTGEVAAHLPTDGSADDAMQVPLLLRDVEGHIASVTADAPMTATPPTRPLQPGRANHRRT